MNANTQISYLLRRILFLILIGISNLSLIYGQEVPILSYSINSNGQAQLRVNSTEDNYYILKVKNDLTSASELATAMTLGADGTTIITEPMGAYPLEHYQVLEYAVDTPIDTDGDGIDDITEHRNIPVQSPINAAPVISQDDGLAALDNFVSYKGLSITDDFVQWSEFLNGKVYVKYIITDFHTDSPKVYFINTDKHSLHADFATFVGVDHLGDQVKKGQVIYHPSTISNNGNLGTFVFNYSNGHGDDFEVVQKTYELLASNMPFLENNLSYFITSLNQDEYDRDEALYKESRVPILFEEEVYADVDYVGFNVAEGFGFFRMMNLIDIPGPKDIVLYDALPNALPRVAGIMTSVIQTPLSHVNLRAIQDDVPNAFLKDPLSIDSISNLLDHYIYYKVEQDDYYIREATQEEVNEWFKEIRPEEEQQPELNLDYKSILPLDSIVFGMHDGFGSKCTNVAVMRSFDFPEGTIPDGFGIPYYFYQEFMRHNNFFEEVDMMISQSDFQADRVVRSDRLDELRDRIKDATMPDWMLEELDLMHKSFPDDTSIRCRSSTNNEDLPGFNGAGLYSSKTQHPDEGHISKSIKQVYASLWNLRAFEERDFYRVDHFKTSMAVLCHPSYSDEKANGVGVSTDPIYNTNNTFYLNSQIGEDLITNPDNNSVPEEILLDKVRVSDNDFILVQRSNLVPSDSMIMAPDYLAQMREYLSVIHDEFEVMYNAVGNHSFAMDIEYKITSEDQLIIKQARPWVSYAPDLNSIDNHVDQLGLMIFPNPASDFISIDCDGCDLSSLQVMSMGGHLIKFVNMDNINGIKVQIQNWPAGIYVIAGVSQSGGKIYTQKFVKR